MSDTRTITEPWTAQSAWAWFRSSLHPFATTIKTNPAPCRWYDPQDLSPVFRSLRSVPGACLQEAVSAAEFDSTLAIALGFEFREEVPEHGIGHAWCLAGPWHETPVDLSVHRLGLPIGYLGAIASPQTLRILAQQNGLELSDGLYERHRILAASPH